MVVPSGAVTLTAVCDAAPCRRPTSQAVSATMSKMSSTSNSFDGPTFTRVGNPEWSLPEIEI